MKYGKLWKKNKTLIISKANDVQQGTFTPTIPVSS